jgi:hypothetical protein
LAHPSFQEGERGGAAAVDTFLTLVIALGGFSRKTPGPAQRTLGAAHRKEPRRAAPILPGTDRDSQAPSPTYGGAGVDRLVRVRGAAQAGGTWADVVRGAVEACRPEAREPAGVRLGGGGDAVPASGYLAAPAGIERRKRLCRHPSMAHPGSFQARPSLMTHQARR